MFSKSLKNSVLLALILLAAPIELVYTSDKDKSLTGTYSASILNTIIKIEELLKKNLNYKVIEIIKPDRFLEITQKPIRFAVFELRSL